MFTWWFRGHSAHALLESSNLNGNWPFFVTNLIYDEGNYVTSESWIM